MRTVCKRLTRGDDIMLSIKALCRENGIAAGVILSGVGCVTRAAVRDASGVTVHDIAEDMEIVSLNGTVGIERCHVHIALAREDMSVIGGHLKEGTLVNTTLELVIGVLDGWDIGVAYDTATGYDEAVFNARS